MCKESWHYKGYCSAKSKVNGYRRAFVDKYGETYGLGGECFDNRKEALLLLWKHLPPCPGGSPSQRQHAFSLCPSTSHHITICSTASYGFLGCDEIHAQLNCRACTVRVNFHFHFHCVYPTLVTSRHATFHSSCCKSVSRKSTMKISSLCRGCPVFCNRLL